MPLSPPAKRSPLHNRTVTMEGYQRDDGLWDIEGHLVDVKRYGFDSDWRGRVEAGTPVHEMWVRLTIDDDMVIQACEAATDNHPFPACAEVTPNFEALAGIKIAPGWMREVRRRVGGIHGCTHIVEMLAQVGTTAYQTLVGKRSGNVRSAHNRSGARKRPPILDTCYALRADGDVARREWPEFYTGSDKKGDKRAG